MNLHFCHVCKEIRDTADGFCVMCHSFLGGTPPEQPATRLTAADPSMSTIMSIEADDTAPLLIFPEVVEAAWPVPKLRKPDA